MEAQKRGRQTHGGSTESWARVGEGSKGGMEWKEEEEQAEVGGGGEEREGGR